MAEGVPRRGRKRRQPGSPGSESSLSVASNQENINIMELHSEHSDTEDPAEDQVHLRKKYIELIDNCQTYQDKDGIEDGLKEKMSKNITEGTELFKKIGSGGPGDMFMAFLHTKMCSGMILSKSEKIGTSLSGFTLEGFINALIGKFSRQRDYSTESLCKWVNKQSSQAQKPASGLKAVLGTFDRSRISKPPEVKEKKQRAPRKKPFDDGAPATQHEEVTLSEEQRVRKDKDSPEAKSQEILSVLASKYKATKKPLNLTQFTMDEKLSSYFQNMFYVSFLVRDGFVSIETKDGKDPKVKDSDLLIAPEKPPEQGSGEDPSGSGTRSQHVVSFNARTFKALAAANKDGFVINHPSTSSHTTSRRKR